MFFVTIKRRILNLQIGHTLEEIAASTVWDVMGMSAFCNHAHFSSRDCPPVRPTKQ
jgi:hypothetical protein